jgi:hypothetical protein
MNGVASESKLRDEALTDKIEAIANESKLRDESLSQKIDLKFDLVLVKLDNLGKLLELDRRMEAIERRDQASNPS